MFFLAGVFTPGRPASITSCAAYSVGQSSRKDWAKIKVTLKQEKTHQGEELQKHKSTVKE